MCTQDGLPSTLSDRIITPSGNRGPENFPGRASLSCSTGRTQTHGSLCRPLRKPVLARQSPGLLHISHSCVDNRVPHATRSNSPSHAQNCVLDAPCAEAVPFCSAVAYSADWYQVIHGGQLAASPLDATTVGLLPSLSWRRLWIRCPRPRLLRHGRLRSTQGVWGRYLEH